MARRRKPRLDVLRSDPRYEKVPVYLECYRDTLDSNNLYFVPDNEDIVLDRYIRVVDDGGVAVVVRNKSRGLKVPRLLKAAFVIFAKAKAGVPIGIADAILKRVGVDKGRASLVVDSIELLKEDKKRAGALKLLDALGARGWSESLDSWFDDVDELSKEELLERLRSLL